MSGMWKRSHGRTSEAPPDERGGYRYVRPTATAPHLDSTLCSQRLTTRRMGKDALKPTSKRTDRRDRELHPDSYRRSCSRRLRVVISIKDFDSPFVRTTTPALEDGASTTAARKPGFSPL